MNKAELAKEVRALREASENYYNDGIPSMSDQEFDIRMDALTKIDPNIPFLK